MARHNLSEKNIDARTAVCSLCGPVTIHKNGTGVICANKNREHLRSWSADNKYRMDGLRAKPSLHALTSKDIEARKGVCPIDGAVDIVPFGRGYACAVRAGQLREKEQDAPAKRCIECTNWDSIQFPIGAAGICLNCLQEDAEGIVPRTTFAADRLNGMFDGEGWSLEDEYTDPYAVEDVRPLHKVIGSSTEPWNHTP